MTKMIYNARIRMMITLISKLSVSPPGCSNAQCSRSLAEMSWNLLIGHEIHVRLKRLQEIVNDLKSPLLVGRLILKPAQHDLHHVEPEQQDVSRDISNIGRK